MGGEGSGRKPDVIKDMFRQIEEQKTQFIEQPKDKDALLIPNYSGIADAKPATDAFLAIDGSNANQDINIPTYDFSVGTDDFFVDNSLARIGIGTVLPAYSLDINSTSSNLFNIESSQSYAELGIVSYRNSAITHGFINAMAARGTKASPLAISSGDAILSIRAVGYGTSGFLNANDSSAGINLTADEDFSGETNKAGKIVFKTAASGDTFMTDKVTIKSSGAVGIGTVSPTEFLDVVGNINIPAANAYKVGGTAGVSGTFTASGSVTFTVTKGIITSIG